MELPQDIWDVIVKQSKMTMNEFISGMNIGELNELSYLIWNRKEIIYRQMKKQYDKQDVIQITHNKTNITLEAVIIDTDLDKADDIITVCVLHSGTKETVFGYYDFGDMSNTRISLSNNTIKIKSKIQERCRKNINVANTLKRGDVFSYNLYTGIEWSKLKKRIYEMEDFNDGIKYGVVTDTTASKIVVLHYVRNINSGIMIVKQYINKNMILNKVEYEDNQIEFIKMKKKFFWRCLTDIDTLKDTTQYFKSVNKHGLIQTQNAIFG